jgi:hypothetical protein
MLDLTKDSSGQERSMKIPIEIDRQCSDETKHLVSGTKTGEDIESNMCDELEANPFD